ncbi:MAG TPA: hypothetical protein VGQ76_23520 [Thermoanaerobaculia bacterium]|jgi:hypothetical protein|nr:hypothetical protein [Thermoanaerobaculia bacterium]
MRVWSRVALVVIVLFSASTLVADHFSGQCPLSLADSTPPATAFHLSPHGVFRSGSLVYALRGQILTTYSSSDVGNLSIAREDFVGSMAARETNGGVAFSNGFLFISSEAGLEIYDLRNTRLNGTAPVLVHRASGFHYRRMAVSGNRLAGLIPTDDLPCYPRPGFTSHCPNAIELLDITDLTAPVRVAAINSFTRSDYRGFNDVAFNYGYLIAVSEEAVIGFDISNLGSIREINAQRRPGKFLVSNGADFLAVGNDTFIDVYQVRPGVAPFFLRNKLLAIPEYVRIGRSHEIRFNRNGYWDEANARLVTMIEEIDDATLEPARTVAFDIFDFTVPQYEGDVERIYEQVTMVQDEEVKHNAVAAGTYIYVIGEETGVQSWGSCGVAAGRIELDSPFNLTCGGGQLHGWVTGQQKIVNVEIFMNNTALGAASLGGPLRYDVSSPTPVTQWRLNVNLDSTARGEYQLRAIATDALGNRRQFAMKRLFFPGPSAGNCTQPRRRSVR